MIIMFFCGSDIYIYIHTHITVSCSKQRPLDFIECITDLREYDVPYHVRVAIDNGKILFHFFKIFFDVYTLFIEVFAFHHFWQF